MAMSDLDDFISLEAEGIGGRLVTVYKCLQAPCVRCKREPVVAVEATVVEDDKSMQVRLPLCQVCLGSWVFDLPHSA